MKNRMVNVSVDQYRESHIWLRINFGKANKCESKKCKHHSKIFDWALIHGKKYECKRKNFKMLCRGCHVKYDAYKGKHLSDKHKLAISEGNKGTIFTKERRKNISKSLIGKSIGMKGRTHSEEAKRKMSESHIGIRHTKEAKLKMSKSQSGKNNSMYGKTHSEKTKKKMSKSCNNSSENNPFYGRKHTEETKRKISISRTGKHYPRT